MKLVLLALLSGILLAQNPNSSIFPAGTVTDTDFLVASDLAITKLNGAIDNVTTSIVLTDASRFTVPMAIAIETERLKCTVKVSNTLTCARGQYGSAAASHITNLDVRGPFMSTSFNQAGAEIKAIETYLQNDKAGTRTFGGVFGADDPSGVALTTAQLTQADLYVNMAPAATLKAAWCSTDSGSQTITLKNGATTMFSTLTCVAAPTTGTTNGSTGYLTSFTSAAMAQFSRINLSATANGTTKRISLFVLYSFN